MNDADNIISLPDVETLELEASEWLMRFEDGDVPEAELSAFHAWRAKSDQHKAAFDEMAEFWGDMDIVRRLRGYAPAAHDAKIAMRGPSQFLMSRRAVFAAVAATVTLMVGGALYYGAGQRSGGYQESFKTAIGEQRTIELPDGSVVEMNTGTSIEIEFTASARDIRLLGGEAYFSVASNRQRPFSVYANQGIVTAVGTEFTVRLRDRFVDVLVTEGRVALTPAQELARSLNERPGNAAPELGALELSPGQNAIFDEDIEHIGAIDRAAQRRKLSWREGRLAFAAEPLVNVVQDVGRYTEISIEFDDEDLRSLPVTGRFNIGDIDAMFEALEIMAGVKVVRVDEASVRLVRVEQDQ